MKRLAISAVLALFATGPAAAQTMTFEQRSEKACSYKSSETLRLKKLSDPTYFKFLDGADPSILQPMLNKNCINNEKKAAAELAKIVDIVPGEFLRACDRTAAVRGDDYSIHSYVVLLECINEQLVALPDADLPRGAAVLHVGNNEYRFWTLDDCLKARKPGQACVTR